MAVLAADFLENYPEFEPLHIQANTLVDAVLARAELRISPSWPSDTRDHMVMLQAADMLARTPMGRAARLSDPKEGKTVYGAELECRKKAFACGRGRVV